MDSGAAFTGGAGNDVFIAAYDSVSQANTLTILDQLDGGAGTDTLSFSQQTNAPVTVTTGAKLSNIEVVTLRAGNNLTADFSGDNVSGLTTISVLQSVDATITASETASVSVEGATGAVTITGGASQTVLAGAAVTVSGSEGAVSISGAKDAIIVDGGSSVTVSDATAAKNITIGATTVATGTVTVTDSNQTTGAIAIDGGAAVTVTASKATTGTVNIGQGGAATDLPSGAITVVTTGAAYAAADTAATRGAINVKGGTTVTVTQTATSSTAAAAKDTTNVGNEVTQSAVTVTGGAATTSVAVAQSAAVAAVNAVTAVAGAQEVQTVTFGAMTANQTLTINGLTFTASKALTAAQVASAFANLSDGAIQGAAAAANGVYSGMFNTVSGSTGAVTTTATASTVTFTSTAKDDVAALTIGGDATGTSVTATTNGSAATAAKTGVMGVLGGVVQVTDANFADLTKADSIKTVSLDGYAANSFVKSDALTNLSLANSAGAFVAHNNSATTLDLTLNKVTGTVSVDGAAAKYTTLNIATTGTKSATALTATAATALKVSGDVALDLTGSTLSALKTVTVSGAAGLTVNASGGTVTAVDTTASTGTNVITIDASKATYTGGEGVDTVTLSASAVAKNVSLGGGNDTLDATAATLTGTFALDGGTGTNTLVLTAAQADTLDADASFEGKISNFQKLSLGQVAVDTANTVNLANMDDISYVISAGGAAGVNGIKETTKANFGELNTGASYTVAGLTVTATQYLSSSQVAEAFAGETVTGATVTGALQGWAAAPAQGNTVTFQATTSGNKADLTATSTQGMVSSNPVSEETTNHVAATTEFAMVSFGSLGAGETVTVGGREVTANSPATESYRFAVTSSLGKGGTIEIDGLTVTATNGDATAIDITNALLTGASSGNADVTGAYTSYKFDGLQIDPNNQIRYVTYTSNTPNSDVADIVFGGSGSFINNGGTLLDLPEYTVQGSAGGLTAAQVRDAVNSSAASGPGWTATGGAVAGYIVDSVNLKSNQLKFTNLAVGNAADIQVVSTGNQPTVAITQGTDAVAEINKVTFSALSSGQVVSVAGRTITATKADLTAAQVEAAFISGTTTGAAVVGGSLNGFAVSNNDTVGDGIVLLTATNAGQEVPDPVISVTNAATPATGIFSNTLQGTNDVLAGALTLTKMANGGTLELTGTATTTTVTMSDATGTADSFNIVTKVDAADLSFGTVAVAGVETVNITATDISPVNTTTGVATISKATLTVSDDAVKAVVVTGNSDLNLTVDGALLTSVDASSATGNLTFSSAVNSAVITGGSGADNLTGTGNNQTLVGGAGADTLVATGDLAVLTGGAGADVFNIGNATSNVNAYATITDFTAGDSIKFSAAASDFIAAKVTLGATAVFQDLANAAIANSDAGDVAWFQHGGDTYVIENVSNNASTFVNGTDIIVKLTGLVDLSTGSFSSSEDTLLIPTP